MGLPTGEELETALREAARLRESGEDDHYLGKTLLNHNYRLELMQEVVSAARRYLHSGESSRAHAELEKAISRVEKASRPSGEAPNIPTLI